MIKVQSVQPLEIGQARVRRDELPLLPIHPPEINARIRGFFQRPKYTLEERPHVQAIARIKRDGGARSRITPDGPHEIGIAIFVRPDAVGRVKVQGDGQPDAVKVAMECGPTTRRGSRSPTATSSKRRETPRRFDISQSVRTFAICSSSLRVQRRIGWS